MKDLIKITTTDSGSGLGTRVYTADGAEVPNITAIDLRLRPDDLAVATISLVAGASEFTAHPLLSRETLEASAAALGLRLVPGEGAVTPVPDGFLGSFYVDENGHAWIGTTALARARVNWQGPFLRRSAAGVE